MKDVIYSEHEFQEFERIRKKDGIEAAVEFLRKEVENEKA